MGVHVANFMDHSSSKTPAALVSNTTGLGSTQTTLLEYHLQEWIGHILPIHRQIANTLYRIWRRGDSAKNNNILKAHNF